MRDIPRDITDEKDMEAWHLALGKEVAAQKSHKDLTNIGEANDSSTDTTKDRHVSDYQMKKIADHMDDSSQHIGQALNNTANYVSDVVALNNKTTVTSPTPSSRAIDINVAQLGGASATAYKFLCGDEIWKNAIGEITNVGAGQGIFKTAINNFTAQLKSLIAGTNISLSVTTDDITINATGAGEVNTASNLGTGVGVYSTKVGADLRFNSIKGNTPINVALSGNDIVIDVNSSTLTLNMLKMSAASSSGSLSGSTGVGFLQRYGHIDQTYWDGAVTTGLTTFHPSASYVNGFIFYNNTGVATNYGVKWDYHTN